MKNAIPVVLFLSVVACGGGPLCESPSRESQFMSGCTASAGSSGAVCGCGWDYLADRHTCEDFDAGNITYGEISNAVDSCMSKPGGAANFKAGVQACEAS